MAMQAATSQSGGGGKVAAKTPTPTTTKIPTVIAKPVATPSYVGSGLYSPGNAGSAPVVKTPVATKTPTKVNLPPEDKTGGTGSGVVDDTITKQLEDLKNQINILNDYVRAKAYSNVLVFEEIGGGLNFKRKKFNEILDLILGNKIETRTFIRNKIEKTYFFMK
jgi:hypothetical protein